MDKDYLIKKWLSDELSDEEWETFKQLDDYEMHIKLSEDARKFKASNFLSPDSFDELKDKISSRPDAPKKLSWYKPFLKIASVFVIFFGLYLIFFSNNQTQIEALTGEKISVKLPDSSEVILNAVSEISYNEEQWTEKRELTLEGEAFFKVAKGSLFDVLTSTGKVAVLGTQFNVKNRQEFFEVICYEGKVSVQVNETLKQLMPGDVLRVVNGKVTTNTIQDKLPDWIKNRSSFSQVPFKEVLLELERQYGVTLVLKEIDVNLLFTGGFTHDDLTEALNAVAIPLGLTYIIQSSKTVVLKNSE